jgi:hypothetical protein
MCTRRSTSTNGIRRIFSNDYAPLDQHERHETGSGGMFTSVAPAAGDRWWSEPAIDWLDQHERHPGGFPNTSYAPLDQHERHPGGFPTSR